MKSFSYYLVDVPRDEHGRKIGNSAKVRTDGPIRCNSIGMVYLNKKFKTNMTRCDYYCLYLIEGKLSVWLDTKETEIKAGDFVIFPADKTFRYEEKENKNIVYYLIHFSGTDVERFLKVIGASQLPFLGHAGLNEKVNAEFSVAFRAFIEYDDTVQERVSICIQRILLELCTAARGDEATTPFSKSINYINSHYSEPIPVELLARLERMSVPRFHAEFKKATGKTPIEYVTEIRIKRACMLLTTTPMQLKEIGEAVGYPDNCFFSKQFKKHVGMTPSKYRATYSEAT